MRNLGGFAQGYVVILTQVPGGRVESCGDVAIKLYSGAIFPKTRTKIRNSNGFKARMPLPNEKIVIETTE